MPAPVTTKTQAMKSTAQRLNESYCKPTTPEEWEVFGLMPLSGHYVTWLGGEPTLISGKFADRAEIPTSHFIDLVHDRIAPWRLVEDGFGTIGGVTYRRLFTANHDGINMRWLITVITDTGRVYINDGPTNVKTYTQLTNLIELIR
jgi:hypothetical protein